MGVTQGVLPGDQTLLYHQISVKTGDTIAATVTNVQFWTSLPVPASN